MLNKNSKKSVENWMDSFKDKTIHIDGKDMKTSEFKTPTKGSMHKCKKCNEYVRPVKRGIKKPIICPLCLKQFNILHLGTTKKFEKLQNK